MPTTVYVDADHLRAHLDKQRINHDDQLDRVIAAATNFVDQKTGRGFRKYEGEARVYPVGRDKVIHVVDLTSSSPTVEIDIDGDRTFSQTIDSGSFRLAPQEADDGSPAVRWQRIEPWWDGDTAHYFWSGYLARITGDWGFYEGANDDPPEGIVYATILLCARWYRRKDTSLQVTSVPAFGFRRMFEKDRDAMDILEEYTHTFRRRMLVR